jgi:hypothetical protein
MRRDLRGRRVMVAVIVLLAGLGLPQAMSGAGCHTVCSAVQPPDCLGCGFTAFRSVFCQRGGCNFCEEDYCGVEAFRPDQKLADEQRVDSTAHKPRVLRVETLAPRS